MKPELQSKFIQHLHHKQDDGFTLIELLVVIVITGILAAIALPHFLNNTAKAKQSEGKQNIMLVNKAQNAYRAEKRNFASTFSLLALGSVSDTVVPGNGTTTNYGYFIASGPGAAFTESVTIVAVPSDNGLKGYSAGVERFDNTAGQSVIGTIMCENLVNGGLTATPPVAVNPPTMTNGIAPACDPAVHTTLTSSQ